MTRALARCQSRYHISHTAHGLRHPEHARAVPLGSWGRATVETAADVERLLDVIEGLNVDGLAAAHQRLVLSPYWMVGGPDYPAMAAAGCPSAATCEYREKLIHNSAGAPSAWPHCRGDLRALYYSGFQHRLWHPQVIYYRGRHLHR
jgi:hypothetical protein